MALTEHTARRGVSFGLLGLGYVGALLFLITRGQMLYALLFTLLPIGAMVVADRYRVFSLSLLTSVALLGIPGIRYDSIAAGLLFQMVVLALFIQDFLMRRELLPEGDGINFFLWIFILNLMVTAVFRGFGFYRLGGDMIGGMTYVQVLVGFLFFLYLRTRVFPERQIERLFVVMVVCSAVPFIIQVAVVSMPSLLPIADFFVFNKARVAYAIADVAGGRGGRYETAVNFSYLLICMGTILKSERKWRGVILSVIGILLLLLSGFRRYAVLSLFVFVLSTVMLSRRRVLTFALLAIAGLGLIAVVYAMAPSLPYNIQRAIAFLPGIGVGAEALQSTEGSFEWRMEIYMYCMEDLPNHLLLGKGLLKSLEEQLYLISYYSQHGSIPYYAFMSGSYHSGFFELILTLGLIGFLSFMGLCGTILWKAWVHIGRHNDGSRLWRILVTLFTVCLAMLVDYLLVRGEFKQFVAPFLLFFGLMVLTYNSHRKAVAATQLESDCIDNNSVDRKIVVDIC